MQKYLSRRGGRFYCLFIDFAQAFDTVDHIKLFESLERKSVRGKFLTILQSMYSNLRSCVRTDKGLTSFFKCDVGTRQGCQLSPILFSLFIQDLMELTRTECGRRVFVSVDIEEMLSLFHADDISSFTDTVNGLQRLINT